MIECFKQEKTEYKILTIAVLAAALFIICRIVYAGIISLPYPKELLEASNVALTDTFLTGRSPYTLSSLKWYMPGVNYDYPFLNSLIAATIAKITGCNSVIAHFTVSIISTLGSGVIGWILAERCSKTTVAPAIAGILFIFCHWRFGYISAAPDDLGMLFLLFTSLVAVEPNIRNKPFWCALGITFCFYTKQYFVFVAPGLFIYMLLYSRRDAIRLLIYSFLMNAVVAAVITVYWPLYWTKAFLFTYVGSFIGGGGELSTLIYQFKYLIFLFAALFVVIIVATAIALKKIYKSNRRLKDIKISDNDPLAMSAVQSVLMLIPLYFLGRNDGALLSYFLQLWIPYIVITALACFERMLPGGVNTKDSVMPENSDKGISMIIKWIFPVIYAAIAVFTLYFGYAKLPLHILTSEEIDQWKKAYEYTEKFSLKGDIFYSRALAYDGFSRGNGEWMCGHEGEPDKESENHLASIGLTYETYPYIHMIVEQNSNYRRNLVRKAENRGYSLITFETGDHFTAFNEYVCEKSGYRCIDRLTLQLGNMPYEVSFYAAVPF